MLYAILCIEDIVVNKVNRLSSRKDAWIHTHTHPHTHTHTLSMHFFFAVMLSFMKTYLCVYIFFDYIYIYFDKLMNSSMKNQNS